MGREPNGKRKDIKDDNEQEEGTITFQRNF
jgi:hypothetical protein